MYTTFFGLNEKPFNISPDPRFLYLSENHKEALAHLIYAVRERMGFIVLTGDVGTGKTTLLNALLSQIKTKIKHAYLFNPKLDIKGFYQFLANAYSLSIDGNKTDFILQFDRFLKDSLHEGENVLLIIDEAQNLKPALLEEIRLLSNMETPQCKLIQIFLVGQEELHTKLNLDSLRQLRQRVSVRYHITPLSYDDTGQYISHRLKVAGFNGGELFLPKSVKEIYKYSSGIPRVINILCDNALVTAFARDRKKIDENILRECARDLSLDLEKKRLGKKILKSPATQQKIRKKNQKVVYILFAIIFCELVVTLYFGRFWVISLLKDVTMHGSNIQSSLADITSASVERFPSVNSNMTNKILRRADKKNDVIPKFSKTPLNSTKEDSKEMLKIKKNEFHFVIAKPGDSISQIALKKYGIVNRKILELIHNNNPEIKDLDFITIGQIIKFPVLDASQVEFIRDEGLYGVHVASFSDFKEAIVELKKWLELGFEAQLIPVMIPSKGKRYRIILGAFNTKSESRTLAEQLLALKKTNYAEAIPIHFPESTKIETENLNN